MKSSAEPTFVSLAVKTAVVHSVTYFVIGALAAHFLHYAEAMARPDSGMRPMTSALVTAGPLFQPLRGILFATVFYPLRGCLFGRKYGWLIMAWMLIAIGILSTFGPVGGSIEGFVYTPTPILQQMRGWLEIVPQATALAFLATYWVNHPEKKWLNWLLGVAFFVLVALDVMALVMHKG